MDIQRARNLTTGILHTKMQDIYEDIEYLIGESAMTHMLPRIVKVLEPHLRKHATDPRFWDGKFDLTHVGEINIPPLTAEENAAAFSEYIKLPNPLAGKDVVVVNVG